MQLPSNDQFSTLCDASTALGLTVQKWTCKDVTNWLKGLDDCVQPYIDRFTESKLDGRELLMLTTADLQDIGVRSVGAQRIISKSLGLLHHLCYEMENENLQTLTSNLSVQARNLSNELKRSCEFSRNTNFGALPNTVLWSISNLAEKTKKIVAWLDKPPFAAEQEYNLLRNSYLTIAIDIVEAGSKVTKNTVDVRQMAKNVHMLCSQLYKICDELIEEAKDPLVIQTAYLDRAEISKRTHTEELGMQIETTSDGLHIVREVKFQTAADLCRKIEAGDEIVEINGQVVVGWSQAKLKAFLTAAAASRPQRLILLLKKRPKDSWNIYKTTPSTPKLKKNRILQPETLAAESPSALSSTVVGTAADVVVHRRRSSSLKMSRKLSDEKAINDRRQAGIITDEFKTSTPNSPASPITVIRFSSAEIDDEEALGDERQRRATISGGSPPLKRLSLHVNRKSSLMPPKSPGQLQRHSMMNDQKPLRFIFSPDSGRHIIPSLNIPKYSTSSISSAEVVEKSTSEDEVFEENVTPVYSPRRESAAATASEEFSEVTVATPTVDLRGDFHEWTQSRNNITGGDVVENWPGYLLNEPVLRNVYFIPNLSVGGPRPVPDSYDSMPEKRKEKLRRFFGEIPSNLPKDADDLSSSSSEGRLSSSSASPKSPFRIHISASKKKKRSGSSMFYDNESASATSKSKMPTVSPTVANIPVVNADSFDSSKSPQLTNVRRMVSAEQPASSTTDLTAERKISDYGNERLRQEYCVPCGNLYKVDFASWVYRTRFLLEKRNRKWAKRYMVLRHDILYLYRKPTDLKAEGIVWLPACRISPIGPEFITSRRYVFQIQCSDVNFVFSCSHKDEMIQWLKKLGLAAIGFFKTTDTGSTNREVCSTYYFPGLLHDDDFSSVSPQCSTPTSARVRPTMQSQSSELLVQTLRKSFNRGPHRELSRESSNDSVVSCQSDRSKTTTLSPSHAALKETRSLSTNRLVADVEKRKL